VPFEVCDRRAKEAVRRLIFPRPRRPGVPEHRKHLHQRLPAHAQEMVDFVDGVPVRPGAGPLRHGQHRPVPLCRALDSALGQADQERPPQGVLQEDPRVHPAHVPATAGRDDDWPAVLEAFDQVGYRGFLTFEYFNPWPHWPEALVYQTSDALDRMLGRK